MSSPDGTDEDAFPPQAIEAGRLLFAREFSFLRGVAKLDGLPPAAPCEVAFAGRSNVGKSSLLNALTGRKALARTSSTPGRTRELNFFTFGDVVCLVDMPGYGYAKAAKSEARRWQALIRDYLRGRPSLKRVFLLVDARHGLKDSDLETMALMDEAAVSYQIVLTKADKVKPAELERICAAVTHALKRRPAAHPGFHITSSAKGTGIAELRAEIALLAER